MALIPFFSIYAIPTNMVSLSNKSYWRLSRSLGRPGSMTRRWLYEYEDG
jgi:hypothetical protein